MKTNNFIQKMRICKTLASTKNRDHKESKSLFQSQGKRKKFLTKRTKEEKKTCEANCKQGLVAGIGGVD